MIVLLTIDNPSSDGTIHIQSDQCKFRGTCSMLYPGGFEGMCPFHKKEFNLDTHCIVRRCMFPEVQR